MSDTLNITIQPTTLTISPNQTDISFTPVDNQIIFYGAGKYSNTVPAAGFQGQLQYNNGGNLDATPLTTYDNGILSLGPVSNVSIGGGASGYVLATDGSGGLTWTHTIADASNATYATTAGSANTANYATTAGSATTANTANLATNATKALGLNATLANTSITGGLNGYLLTTDGNGALSWSKPVTTGGVTQILPGNGISVSNGGIGNVTITNQFAPSAGQVNKIIAGNNITITSTGANGTGEVTINGNAGGGSAGNVVIYLRDGAVNIPISSGNLTLVGRNGNIKIATS
jgi:hypothetical protein